MLWDWKLLLLLYDDEDDVWKFDAILLVPVFVIFMLFVAVYVLNCYTRILFKFVALLTKLSV